MRIGRVAGHVVSTINSPVYEDRRLLLCDLLDERLQPTGDYLIAVDTVGSGADETVLILDEGNSARQVLSFPDGEIRALVVGIVDRVDLAESG
jgi:ethanolamine utilization protein EutN